MESNHSETEHISKLCDESCRPGTMLSPNQIGQYRSARAGASLIDRHQRGRVALRGNDRKTFLHALLTNDIAVLGPGSGCYAALLTPLGRMVTDMRVFETEHATLLDVPFAPK